MSEAEPLAGRRAVVTGGATGIGAAVSEQLARAGADVVIASRDTAAGARTAAAIDAGLERDAVRQLPLDLASLASVDAFAEALGPAPLDILVNNAGAMGGPLRRSEDDVEMLLAVNFLGHFRLSTQLAERLAAGTEPRLVQLSSAAHRFGAFDFEDPDWRETAYDPNLAYARAKTACALLAVGFQERFGSRGIDAFAVAPGVVDTGLLDHLGLEGRATLLERLAPLVRTPEEAAESVVYAATSPDLAGRGGIYIEDGAPAGKSDGTSPGGVVSHAVDPDDAERLWRLAETLVAG